MAQKQDTRTETKPVEAETLSARVTEKNGLWRELCRVNPAATKPFQKAGGFRGSQIDPTYRLQQMTEVFGPVGHGWGYTVTNRRQETWGNSTVAFATIRAWYIPPDQEPVWRKDANGNEDRSSPPSNAYWTGEQDGGTVGDRAPDEVWKMTITDGFGKCVLQIGLAADVYLGKMDDSKYKEDEQRAYASDRAQALLKDLAEKLPPMTKLSEIRTITGSHSYRSRLRETENNDTRLADEIKDLVSFHDTRLGKLIQDDVKEKLTDETREDDFKALSTEWRHALRYLENRELKEKIVRAVVEFGERFKETEKAPEKPQDAPAKQEARTQASKAQNPQESLMGPLPVVELTKGNNGAPRWGKFTNDLVRVFENLPEEATESNVMAFMHHHQEVVSKMEHLGGDYVDYAQKVYAARDRALDTFQGEGA